MRPLATRILLFALLALLPAWAVSGQAEPEKLITVRTGTLPIILSAPHGGRSAIPGVAERKGDGVTKFTATRDEHTDELAEKLAAAVEKRLAGKPYLVIAYFERKQVDVNRPAKDAYESDQAKPYFDAYHRALADACKDVQKHWGRGLLLDIHGQGAEAQAIFRGTNNGRSITHLTGRFGKSALTGPKGVLGVLAAKGYTLIPANDSADPEDKRFNGGYTVQTYGSASGGLIDAVQLELGADLRAAKNQARTAADLAEAIEIFAKEYLPPAKPEK